MKVPNIDLKVEMSAGTKIGDACIEAVELARKLNVCVWFVFNGVNCLARPFDKAEAIVEAWHTALVSKRDYKIAAANL